MSRPSVRHAVSAALLALSLTPSVASSQVAARDAIHPGSFVGSDSLDARMEPGTSSRGRRQLHGTATWTIERDTLDLRPKFTIRIELPEPSPVTIVIRSLDSLPPAPGRYTFFLAATGASHTRAGVVNLSVYTREGGKRRSYVAFGDSLVITSARTHFADPLVSGRLFVRSSRYSSAPTGSPIRDEVLLDVSGDFTAMPARDRRPVISVTERMQRAVLERALIGFAITSAGAINGDVDAVDSTHSPALGRAYLDARWHDALIVDHIEANDRSFKVRVRGRFVPMVCEQGSHDYDAECSTLPRQPGR